MKAKISQEELDSLREAISNLNESKIILGDLQTQAHFAQIQVIQMNEKLEELKKSLEDSYGSINLDINTGEYEEAVEEAVEA